MLDPILEGYVEGDLSVAELEAPASTPTPCAASSASSTATSTSGASRRRVCGSRPRRSARTVACRSPTAGPASSSPVVQCSALVAEAALVVAALLYGVTFPLVHDALDDITPFAYLVGRFGIATLLLAPVTIPALRARGRNAACWCAPG